MKAWEANAKATHIIFSKNIRVYAIFNDQSFNNMLTNDIVSFEQLGPEKLHMYTVTQKCFSDAGLEFSLYILY